jgi:Fe-S-cluster-containing dehydrogenase component
MKKKRRGSTLLTRRDILKIGAATGSAVAVTQLITMGPVAPEAMPGNGHETGTGKQYEWHMVIDLDRCIGCQYCIWTCQAVNDVPANEMRWNVGFPERTERGEDFFMTRPCLHCNQAPCVKVCPVGATWMRDDGLVVMDYDRCIGCRYCEVACPYDVRRFNWRVPDQENPYRTWGEAEVDRRPRGVVEKCTFCVQRIDRGLAQGLVPGVDPQATPACVVACPTQARLFGNLNDPDSPISRYIAEHETFRLREDFGAEPKVHYAGPGKEA